MVEWFYKDKSISIFENNHICEYTNNMHLVRQSAKPRKDVLKACCDANNYLEPFEHLIKSKRSHSKKKNSAPGLSETGPETHSRNAKGKTKNKNGPTNSVHVNLPEPVIKHKRNSASPGKGEEGRAPSPAKTTRKPESLKRPVSSVVIYLVNDSSGATGNDNKKRKVHEEGSNGGMVAQEKLIGLDSDSENDEMNDESLKSLSSSDDGSDNESKLQLKLRVMKDN